MLIKKGHYAEKVAQKDFDVLQNVYGLFYDLPYKIKSKQWFM